VVEESTGTKWRVVGVVGRFYTATDSLSHTLKYGGGKQKTTDATGVRHAVLLPPCRQNLMQDASSRAASSSPWLRLPRLLPRQAVSATLVGARAGEGERRPVACRTLRTREWRGGGQRPLFSVAHGIDLRLGRVAPRPSLQERARSDGRIGIKHERLLIPKRMGVGFERQTGREGGRVPAAAD